MFEQRKSLPIPISILILVLISIAVFVLDFPAIFIIIAIINMIGSILERGFGQDVDYPVRRTYKKLQRVKVEIPCVECRKDIPFDSEVCPFCGARQKEYIECEYCGHKNAMGSSTCEECDAIL
jgi:hypothetical protein